MLRSIWLPAALVLILYGAFLAGFLRGGGDPYSLIHVGSKYINANQAGSVIRPRPGWTYEADGYDGQFVYYIALDPVGARSHLDVPVYRYTRILYPMAARAAALGRPDLLPWTLIGINVAAVVAGVLALGSWLARRGQPAMIAAAYGLYPGLFISATYDLTEPLCYALALAGVLCLDSTWRLRHVGAGLLFGLAALTREQALVFTAAYAAAAFLPRPTVVITRAQAAVLTALAVLPWLAWRIFLSLSLRSAGPPLGDFFEVLPFRGFHYWLLHDIGPTQTAALPVVILPGLICAGAAIWGLRRRAGIVEAWLALLCVIPFVVFLHRNSYVDLISSGRVAIPAALAATLCLPELVRAGIGRGWFWISAGLWLSPMPAYLGVPILLAGISLLRGG